MTSKVTEAIAANIRAERARAGLSQKQVADGMRERGHATWHPQTVGAVERGERQVWAAEVYALAGVLGADPETLWRVPLTG
jgi:transcriptional regulator with XRE-family HTH domain